MLLDKCSRLVTVLGLVGCSNASLLGVSADVDPQGPSSSELTSVPPLAAYAPRVTTVIRGSAEEHTWTRRPSLGDVDGDGFDDFLIEASWTNAQSEYGNRAFLFYGRADLPAQLSTADADAVLEAGELPATTLGDINGDGLMDFALGDYGGFEIIFGSSTRLAGEHKRFTHGLVWYPTTLGQGLLFLRPLGDVDGDNKAELRVTVISEVPDSEIGNRTSELITDYVIAGRGDGWPSGLWDPTWAVAMLGDEPPSFEDDGVSTVLQRLSIAGTGDLDGDGYTDLLALGRWRMWVFYGSERGFQGTLTTAQADASLTWPYDMAARRADFAKTIPMIIGDVNGDGAVDIGVPHQAELGIVYGTKQRWSGRVELQPELTVVRASSELPERNWWLPLSDDLSYGAPLPELVSTLIKVGVADLDGDAERELVLHETRYPEFETTQTTALYTLTGPNKSATGRYVLTDANLYRADGVSDTAAALSRGTLLDPGGDFDGDGCTDLVFGVADDPQFSDAKASLHLVPGTPRAPD